MQYSYTSIDRIFAKFARDISANFDEGDLIEWTGEALEFIGSVKLYEEAVAIIEVKNHQFALPNGIHQIQQIARDTRWKGPDQDPLCPAKVILSLPYSQDPPPSLPVVMDCYGSPMSDYDLAYYRPYYDLKAEHLGWHASDTYRQRFTPIRLATSSFGLGLVDDQKDCQSCQDEYQVIRNKIVRVSFREGSVSLSFLRQVLDEETGYPLIPDTVEHTTAITKYITMKTQEREFYAGRDGAKMRLDKAEADWQWYCKMASNKDLMPHGIDEHQNWLDSRQRMLPNNRQYFGFFGNMNKPERRKFDDPDRRNFVISQFRGTML